jgi:glutamine amidotransferase
MCLIAFKNSKNKLPKWALENGFHQNDEGAGFAVVQDKKIIVQKGFFEWKTFWKAFKPFAGKGLPALVHFRLASSGSKDKKNCHPFFVNDNLVFAHNGRLNNWEGSEKDKKSDTRWFNEAILQPLFKRVPDAHLDRVFQCLLESEIGTGNKIVFLDSLGRHSILRENAGEWYKGVWYSNDSFKKEPLNPDLLSEEEWKKRHGRFLKKKQEENDNEIDRALREWEEKEFKPTTETEKILGAKSHLGEVERPTVDPRLPAHYQDHKTIVKKTVGMKMTDRAWVQDLARRIGKRGYGDLLQLTEQGIVNGHDLREMMR